MIHDTNMEGKQEEKRNKWKCFFFLYTKSLLRKSDVAEGKKPTLFQWGTGGCNKQGNQQTEENER